MEVVLLFHCGRSSRIDVAGRQRAEQVSHPLGQPVEPLQLRLGQQGTGQHVHGALQARLADAVQGDQPRTDLGNPVRWQRLADHRVEYAVDQIQEFTLDVGVRKRHVGSEADLVRPFPGELAAPVGGRRRGVWTPRTVRCWRSHAAYSAFA
jgi:hypothetical protein